jgi:hypothetical protein
MPAFKDFQNESAETIRLTGLVVSAGNFIAALVTTNAVIQHPYPHIVLYSGHMKAREASELIALTITQNAGLRSAYKAGTLK